MNTKVSKKTYVLVAQSERLCPKNFATMNNELI